MEQETLIYIDDKEKYDASVAANFYSNKDVKNRVYVNTLGAELVMKYLKSENVEIGNVQNIHSVKKILEEFDISDVMLKNIHIDVRVVFDEQAIFIPKSHFEYNLVPDIYVVFQLASDNSYVKFLGFFEPKLINKNNANKDYYFIEKEKLNSPLDFVKYVKNFNGDTNMYEAEDYEVSLVSMADNAISDYDKRILLQQLAKSADLREKFIEYENFEMLSSCAMTDTSIEKPELDMEDVSDGVSDDITDNSALSSAALSAGAAGATIAAEAAAQDVLGENELISDAADSISLNESDIPVDNLEGIVEDDEFNINKNTLDSDMDETKDEKVDLDSIETLNSEISLDETAVETIDLNDFDTAETNVNVEPLQEEKVDIDNLPAETFISEDSCNVETVPVENSEEKTTDGTDDSISLDEFVSLDDISTVSNETTETPSAENSEDVVSLESFELPQNTVSDNEDNSVFDNISLDDSPLPEEPTDYMEEKNTSFGNNLLENLAAEEENVAIEPMTEPEKAESNELLSQLENVLTTSAAAGPDEASGLAEINASSSESSDYVSDSNGLNVLFNENEPAPSENIGNLDEYPEQNYAGAALTREKSGSKNVVVTALLIAALLGAGAFMYLKPKNDNVADVEPIPVTEEIGQNDNDNPAAVSEVAEPVASEGQEDQAQASQETQASTSQKSETAAQQETPTEVAQSVSEEKPNVQPKRQSSNAFMSVSRLTWNVPDSLSRNADIQSYLKAAGKSIKLSLSADLLLATEFAYSNQAKVSLVLSQDGTVQSAKMASGSGSSQIDSIVLQSVKDTLNVVKPPSNAVQSPSFNLDLIIYF